MPALVSPAQNVLLIAATAFVAAIGLTTSDAERDVLAARELRADSYLVKPGDRGSFARLVREVEQRWLNVGRSRRGPDA